MRGGEGDLEGTTRVEERRRKVKRSIESETEEGRATALKPDLAFISEPLETEISLFMIEFCEKTIGWNQ